MSKTGERTKEAIKFEKALIIGILIALGIFFAIALRPYYVAILSSIILFTLFNPLYNFFVKKVFKGKKILSVALVLLAILLVVIIPLMSMGFLIVNEAVQLSGSGTVKEVANLAEKFIGKEQVSDMIEKSTSSILNYIKDSFIVIISSIIDFFVSIIIMFFLLFFMFTQSHKIDKAIRNFLPFSDQNVNKLVNNSINVTKSTIWGSGLIAIMQGLLIGIGFLIFGIEGALVWGLIAGILSFIPGLGVPMVYIPASAFMFLDKDYVGAIGILLWGIVLVSSIDNILRPTIGKKLGKIHPLITLIGVIVGIKYFSIIGIVIGPLLLSYFFIILKMYKKEFIDKN